MSRDPIYDVLLAKLAEPSTVAGLVLASGLVVGHAIAPEYAGAVATWIAFVASAVLVWVKEAK